MSSSATEPDGGAPARLRRVLLGGGAVGFLASFVLLVEKIELLKDPAHVPSCSINPILSCGSIMKTSQAELFGFPNPILGVAGFAVVTTVAAALLGGATFRRWFWWGLQGGATASVVLIHWLIFQSLYRIDALCPYCMVVWVVTIPVFWYTTLHTTADVSRMRWAREYHGVVLTAWYLIIVGLITNRFWDYWSTLLT